MSSGYLLDTYAILRVSSGTSCQVKPLYLPRSVATVERLLMSSRFVAVPLTQKEAKEFITRYHRHHKPSVGDIFRIGLANNTKLVGVAMVGRPVSRRLDDNTTAEVTRCCIRDIPEARHAASALYAKCWRVARELGFTRLITYTLDSESGISLIATGWHIVHKTPGGSWSCNSRLRNDEHPLCPKILWEVTTKG
jgi:hypothetical protein